MRNIGLFRKKKVENRADETGTSFEELIAYLSKSTITKSKALQIPALQGGINKLAEKITSLPLKLYKQNEDGTVEEVKDDIRLKLLNDDTGDTLNANEFWKAMLEDYFLGDNGGMAYINKSKGQYKSLHYVDSSNVSVLTSTDKIFKDYQIYIDGNRYYPFEFLKIKRKTKDGATNITLQAENSEVLQVAYNRLIFERILLSKGGNKKGFFESERRLDKTALEVLKTSLQSLYNRTDEAENFAILNDGIKFHESSSTPLEMQLNENKKSDINDICLLLGFPHTIIDGGASEEDKKQFNSAVINILTVIETALDRDFLLEKEKGLFYWAFDTKALTRGDVKERFAAYEIALKNNFMQLDEVRQQEDLKPLGFNFLKLGLGDVFYDPKTKEIYTPNTNQTTNLEKGGVNNENGN